MSRGKLQQSMSSKSGGTSGRFQSKENFEDVEIIDLDSVDADVEIIDGSKFVRKEATNSPNCVISIDDDDDDEEESGTDSLAETSGNRYGFPRNRYGLDFASETESFGAGTSGSKDSNNGVGFSDGEGSDCEILDGSSGSIRQEWEQAHSRKATPPERVQSAPTRQNVENNNLNKSFEDSFDDFFSPRNRQNEGGASSSKKNASKEEESFVPGMFQEEIRERVSIFCSAKTFFSMKPCSDSRKGKSVSSSPEKMEVEEEEISKEAPLDEEMNDEEGKENTGEDNSALVSVSEVNAELEHDDGCLVGEREKHKESDEYRRADEAEWAARQEELRIQAEEAQKLKKRRKAETMRLLDMEKRQKQRLEEIRENQKKNEETLSLKEELRAEVRKDLEKMEKRHTDMASILRGLGISVGGGLFPIPSQVKAAYKQALLKFHPDRVQMSDVHQQVKAEETFKFISRLKEKLLPVT